MTDLEQHVRTVMRAHEHEAPDASALDLTRVSSETLTGRATHGRSLGWAVSVIAAVLTLAFVVFSFVKIHDSASRGTYNGPASTTSPGPTTSTTPDAYHPDNGTRQAQAAAEAHRLVDTVVLPSGARRLSAWPVDGGHRPSQLVGADTFELAASYWTSKLPMDAVYAAIKNSGWSGPGTGVTKSGGQVVSRSLSYLLPKTLPYFSRQLDVEIVPYLGGSAILATAQVSWTPARPAWSYLTGITSADVTVIRTDSAGSDHHSLPTVHRTLTDTTLGVLVQALNDAPMNNEGVHSCPAMFGTREDIVVLRTSSGAAAATATLLLGCGNALGLSITGHGGASTSPQNSDEIGLLPTTDLDAQILAALGLPTSYSH